MCLILLAHRILPEYPLVLAANRDEFYERPTASARFWPEAPQLLAGRDLQGGGTWLGVTRSGGWAAVTNYREAARPMSAGRSRGALVLNFLTGEENPGDYLAAVAAEAQDYPGFNLLAGTPEEVWYLSNHDGAARPLPPGVYGLSNALLDTPWPKVVRSREAFQLALNLPGAEREPAFFDLLSDRREAPDAELPDTGFGLEWERLLSPPFILSPGYGTRSSTVLTFSRSGEALLTERSFPPGKGPGSFEEVRYSFPLRSVQQGF